MFTRLNFRFLLILLVFLIFSSANSKVPYKTIHLKIRKQRFEGDPRYFKSLKLLYQFKDKLDVLEFEQEIWVDVENNSYLEIEMPGKGNDLTEKNGRLKYEGRHYNLDFDLEIALDVTDVGGKIYDNYTSETPDYKYYNGNVVNKVKITCDDGKKRKAKIYSYKILDSAEDFSSQQYIKEIKSSDMPEEAKKAEIAAVMESREKKATEYMEWIWVHGNEEQQMFLRKTETLGRVMTMYNITLLEINKNIDKKVFENILNELRVKKSTMTTGE